MDFDNGTEFLNKAVIKWAAEMEIFFTRSRPYKKNDRLNYLTRARRVRWGDIHVAATRGAYTTKPRPVVIVQDDRFDASASVTVCPLTTNPTEAPLIRIAVASDDATGIDQPSRIMVDKVTTIPPVRTVLSQDTSHGAWS